MSSVWLSIVHNQNDHFPFIVDWPVVSGDFTYQQCKFPKIKFDSFLRDNDCVQSHTQKHDVIENVKWWLFWQETHTDRQAMADRQNGWPDMGRRKARMYHESWQHPAVTPLSSFVCLKALPVAESVSNFFPPSLFLANKVAVKWSSGYWSRLITTFQPSHTHRGGTNSCLSSLEWPYCLGVQSITGGGEIHLCARDGKITSSLPLTSKLPFWSNANY